MATGRIQAENELLADAFLVLLEHGQPIPPVELGDRSTLDALDRAGRLRRDATGRVVAAHGLSIVPSRHELDLSGKRFWTWCAYDAFGIAGALEADALLRTHDPAARRPRMVQFTAGAPAGDGAVFLPRLETCSSVVEEWCPHANVFATVEAAEQWAEVEGVPGEAVTFAEASRRGTALWSDVIAVGRRAIHGISD